MVKDLYIQVSTRWLILENINMVVSEKILLIKKLVKHQNNALSNTINFQIQLTFWENHFKVLSAMRLILDLYINSNSNFALI